VHFYSWDLALHLGEESVDFANLNTKGASKRGEGRTRSHTVHAATTLTAARRQKEKRKYLQEVKGYVKETLFSSSEIDTYPFILIVLMKESKHYRREREKCLIMHETAQ